ncbi:hypothetical protein H477_5910 [[Clostridium] sordellii ATCC 9714]|nr:hypothetical protein H477_5910 [[Clostridium] sordellii ATCC 9714] [Paeniclostridium sordellii ATCC 9714]
MGIDTVYLTNEFKNHFSNSEKSKSWLEKFIEKIRLNLSLIFISFI